MFTHETRSYNMGSYASDVDGGPLKIHATYSKNGGSAIDIPNGIFSLTSNVLGVVPTSP